MDVFFRISLQNPIVRRKEIITFRFNGTSQVNGILIFHSLTFDFFRPIFNNLFLIGINKNCGINKKIFDDFAVGFVGIVAIFKNGHVGIGQLKSIAENKILDVYFCLGFQEHTDLTLIIKRPVIATIIKIDSFFSHDDIDGKER
ncbi:MAG: hypothetical protein FWH27_06870 [Planctomycetaceae bacterium]|nr:hypothetical protein [Planctomycetaceae bacterium]